MNEQREESTSQHYAEALREATLRYQRLVQDLSILKQMDEIDDPRCNLEEICRRMVEVIAFGFAAENCSLMLMDDEDERLKLRAACSPFEERGVSFRPGDWFGRSFELGEGIVGKVAQDGVSIRVDDVSKDRRFVPQREGMTPVGSILCFPLYVNQELVGVLNLSHSQPHFFTEENERSLALIAERAARILASHAMLQRLCESEAHHRLVTENAGDAIIVYDGGSRVVSVNPVVGSITGEASEDFAIGRREWKDFVHPEDLDTYQRHRKKVLDSLVADRVEYRLVDSKHRIHFLEQTTSPMVDPYGNITGMVEIVRDVTERVAQQEEKRRLEEQIRHTQKLESLGVLAGGIAHDFNNLLTSIVGYATLAMADIPESSPALQSIVQIETAGMHAADLCRQMLAYSGKGRFQVRSINLSSLVQQISDLLSISISKKARLDFRLAQNLAPIMADSTQMNQVIMNLITNASDAIGSSGGTITIATCVRECTKDDFERARFPQRELQDGEFVCLEIADTGAGMSQETLGRVFEPFFTTKFSGRGLGLAAVLGIVRGHSGFITVDSKVGEGSVFRVFFPVCQTIPEEAASRPERKSEWKGTGTILVADDEPSILRLTESILSRMGLKVITARNGLEALQMFQNHSNAISAILLDMTMPELDGAETFTELRCLNADVPIVLMSGYDENDARSHFGLGDLTGFLHKPFGVAQLTQVMQDALGRSE